MRRPKIGKSLIKYVATPKFVFQYLAGTPHSLLSPSPAPHQKEVFILVQNLLESFPPTTNQSAKTPGAKMSNLTRRMPQDSASGNLFDTRTKHRHNFCREGPKNQDWNVFTHLRGSMVLHCQSDRERELPKGRGFAKYFQVLRNLLLIFQLARLARLARLLSQRLNQLVTSRGPRHRSLQPRTI